MNHPRAIAVGSHGSTLSLLGHDGGVATVDLALERPSHLATHPARDVVYVALETDPGAVAAVDLTARPRVIDVWQGLPANPCHVTVEPGGRWLYACCYLGGAVAALPLEPGGAFDPRREQRVLQSTGSGQHSRQESSHPHSSLVVNSHLAVADLGTDEVRFYRLQDGEPVGPARIVTLPGGSGPRSLTSAGSVIACSLELQPGIAWLAPDDAPEPPQVTPLGLQPPAQPSEVVIVDGVGVIAVRGSDVIGVASRTGGVLAFVDSPRGARGLAAVPGGVLAAAEKDDVVVEYAVSRTGIRETGAAWPVESPAAVAGWPRAWQPRPALQPQMVEER